MRVAIIMNLFPLTNITSSVSFTSLCNFYKISGIFTYYSVATLLVLCVNVFPLTPSKYGQIVDSLLVMLFTVIGQFGGSLILAISFYSSFQGWPTIPCSRNYCLAL